MDTLGSSKYYDVALISSYHGDPLSPDWYVTVKEAGKKCVVITPNPNEYESLVKQGVETIYLNDYFPATTPDRHGIEKYFASLGIQYFRDYLLNEQAYYYQSLGSISRIAYRYAFAYRAVFENFKFGCVLHFTQGGEVVRRLPTLIAGQKDIPVIYLGETFIPGTMTLYSDEYRTLIDPKHERRLDDSEIQKIINNKLEKKPVVSYEADKRSHQPIPSYRKILNHIRDKNWYIIKAYLTHKRLLHIDPPLKKLYLRWASIYDAPRYKENEKFFYYPLNVGAESELYIRNPEYVDQAGVVERLSSYLPVGYKLYVKTHPSKEGLLKLRDYHRLKRLENVRLLDPINNSYEIVKNSLGVLLVSGTIAQEGYLMGKPICILGNWPFKKFGTFITVESLSGEVFEKILSAQNKRINPADLIQNLYKYSFKGSAYSNKDQFKILVYEILQLIAKWNKQRQGANQAAK